MVAHSSDLPEGAVCMNTFSRCFTVFFVIIMMISCLWLIVWVPLNAYLDFRLSEAAMDLETSQGRERKQDFEYNQVVEAIPLTRQELDEAQPRADSLLQEVTDLKASIKELRAENKRLEELLEHAQQEAGASAPEEDADE